MACRQPPLWHEYAHYVEEQISALPWIISTHNGCTTFDAFGALINSSEHAWMEGFANWFAQAVRAAYPGAGLANSGGSGTPSVSTLESSPGCPGAQAPTGVPGHAIEDRVAGVLWDLSDTTNESQDELSGYEDVVMQIVDHEQDVPPGAGRWPNIHSFRNAWAARGLSVDRLDLIFALNGITPGFRPNQDWTAEAYYGDRGTYFADVNGDGHADAIVVNDDKVTVRPSTGSGFGAYEDWTAEAYYGDRGTYFADVNGDGHADAIVVNDDKVTVRPSTGSGFGPYEDWTAEAYYGDRGTYLADVNGDGHADAIVVNDDKVTVRPSTGSGFGAYEDWTAEAYYGDRGTYFADVNGDGHADAIVVNDDKVTVRPSP